MPKELCGPLRGEAADHGDGHSQLLPCLSSPVSAAVAAGERGALTREQTDDPLTDRRKICPSPGGPAVSLGRVGEKGGAAGPLGREKSRHAGPGAEHMGWQ